MAKNKEMENILRPFINFEMPLLTLVGVFILIFVIFALILKCTPSISLPELPPIKSPFGKLPFFDGVILYGILLFVFLIFMGYLLSLG